MSEDFDVISGPPATPPRMKPSPPPEPAPRRSSDAADKMAAVPRAPAGAK